MNGRPRSIASLLSTLDLDFSDSNSYIVFDMDVFIHSCNTAATYPKNIIYHGEYQHTLQTYLDDLDKRETDLFGLEEKASLDFWDLDDKGTSTCFCTVSISEELSMLIGINSL